MVGDADCSVTWGSGATSKLISEYRIVSPSSSLFEFLFGLGGK